MYHHWGCTSIYRPLSYPFRSLRNTPKLISLYYFRGQGYGYGDERGIPGGGRGGNDSDSDSELDIEGTETGPGSPDISAEENNNSGLLGDRSSRDRHDSGGADDDSDLMNKTSSSPTLSPGLPSAAITSLGGGIAGGLGGLSNHTSWPAHPAFSLAGLNPPNPLQAAHTLNKITSQFWAAGGFDRVNGGGLNSLLPPPLPVSVGGGGPPLSFSFPALSFPAAALSQSMFKLPNVDDARNGGGTLFRFKTS